jgi:predicted nucleic acid-binding Zn finger protein
MNALGTRKHTQVRIRTKGMKRWLCSCENFLFEKSGKRRHCRHLHEAKRAAMKKYNMRWKSL